MTRRCRNCDRPLRPSHALAADHPGTVQETARGLCQPCYRNPHRDITRHQYPRPCANCEIMMRPKTAPQADYPTSRERHAAHGLCHPCYNKRPTDTVDHAYNVRALNRYIAARNQRKKRLELAN